METQMPSEQQPRVCEHCAHFREDEWNTGYCQRHTMFVLKSFSCVDFTPCETVAAGGPTRQE